MIDRSEVGEQRAIKEASCLALILENPSLDFQQSNDDADVLPWAHISLLGTNASIPIGVNPFPGPVNSSKSIQIEIFSFSSPETFGDITAQPAREFPLWFERVVRRGF
jgi:hypothetical protein